MIIGTRIRMEDGVPAFIEALKYAITVLVVSCPCAIGLAVPMVIVISSGVGADHGLIFKTAQSLDRVRQCTHVLLDKTGTVTMGKNRVFKMEFFGVCWKESEIAKLGFFLTQNNQHPIARAINEELEAYVKNEAEKVPNFDVNQVKSIPGKGIRATIADSGSEIRGGNPNWIGCSEHPSVKEGMDAGNSIFCLEIGSELVAVFQLRDQIRPETGSVIQKLTEMGITVGMISGDHTNAVDIVAQQVGISHELAFGNCDPVEKQQLVKRFQNEGGVVLFVGDGTNDSIALAQSDVGVSISTHASAISASAADLAILRDDLTGILVAIQLSKATFRRIAINFVWAFVYNFFAILLAAGAFVSVRISPQYAGLAEIISVVPVILVALHLKWAFRNQSF